MLIPVGEKGKMQTLKMVDRDQDGKVRWAPLLQRGWYLIAENPAPSPHLARPEGRAALMYMCYLLCSVLAALPLR